MSNRYKGGVISATPPTTTGGNDGVASGAWTLEQQMQAQAAGLWPNQPVYYVEDVFNTYLWSGNSSSQSINIGFNLLTSTAMTWFKDRTNADGAGIVNTVQGNTQRLVSYATDAGSNASSYFGFTSTGYNFPSATINTTGSNYVGWTFKKTPKFFDVVTYTGDGTNPRNVSHSLGSKPGFVVIKRTDNLSDWAIWHRGNGTTAYNSGALQATDAIPANTSFSSLASSTTFTVGTGGATPQISGPTDFFNTNGATYVAYLFAHNAGGFGLTGTDNVISCGSFTAGSGVDTTISLGYEPQWVLVKASSTTGNWRIIDSMRGIPTGTLGGADDATLSANLSDAENLQGVANLSSTGFAVNFGGGNQTYIYIAIRRGPMKKPTDGTTVYNADAEANATAPWFVSDFPVDFAFKKVKTGSTDWQAVSRLTGTGYLTPNSSAVEDVSSEITFDFMNGWNSTASANSALWSAMFKRAPSVFDVVCFSGNGTGGLAVTHNLGVVPELMILKKRNGGESWIVYTAPTGNSAALYLSSTAALETTGGAGYFNNTTPTATQFTVGNYTSVNSGNMIAYLFATLAGVSKVGSYTGTATTLQIDCGFTAGSRFVLIKRTDSTGDWYVWDSARGIVAGNDPYLLLNSTAAEVTGTDYVDTYAAGFEISSTAPAAINASGGTFIFLAIA